MAHDTRVHDLHRLMERALEAGVNDRATLAATLFSRAETIALQLHDDTCLVPAWLRYYRGAALHNQAVLMRNAAQGTPREDVDMKEAIALRLKGWELVQGVLAVLERRTATGTVVRKRGRNAAQEGEERVACVGWTCSPLLHLSQKYGTCRKEEVAFYRRLTVVRRRAKNLPAPTTHELDDFSPAVGYVLSTLVAANALNELLGPVPLVANVQQRVEAFVLSTVDSMLDIANVFPHYSFPEEIRWISSIEKELSEPLHSEFITALRARWTAAPFQTMLRARGLSNATAEENARCEIIQMRRDADVAAQGLHPCGLPSCDEREVSVKQFKYCGDCEAEWYCCAEHQVLHWKEHKPICRARTAAAALAAITLE